MQSARSYLFLAITLFLTFSTSTQSNKTDSVIENNKITDHDKLPSPVKANTNITEPITENSKIADHEMFRMLLNPTQYKDKILQIITANSKDKFNLFSKFYF